MSNNKIMEKLIGKNMEGNGYGLFEVPFQNLPDRGKP
jgi:hypothetical protein